MNPKITIIVPVYKVQPYLSKCLDSIIHQTYDNLEIILVDDGSPDECPSICDRYSKRDRRIKVIHKENGGLSSARNAGLQIATGKYISFVDSDDWLEHDMYSVLFYNLVSADADVSVCAHISEYGTEDLTNPNQSKSFSTICYTDTGEIYKHLLPNSQPSLLFMVWNKLFKREVIGDVLFQVGQIYEDMYFDREVFKKCKKVIYSTYKGYHYRIGRSGSTATFFKEIKLNKFKEIESYIEFLNNQNDISGVNEYNKYGCDTAIELYYSAWSHNIDDNIKKRIKESFDYFYKNKWKLSTSAESVPARIKKFIFHGSPITYCFLYNTYTIMKKCCGKI